MPEHVSEHETVRRMTGQLQSEGLSHVNERWEAQETIRCKQFCAKGISCQLCTLGPCRIRPGTIERGACGIDADAMAMRNFLQKDTMGIANYTIHARDAALTLRATAEGQTPFAIKDPAKVDLLASKLGVRETDPKAKAAAVAEKVLASLNQSTLEESVMVEAFATASRKKLWRDLGLFPGGPFAEIADAAARSMTNIDGDYVSLAKAALRLGLASAFGSLVPLELVQDALFGTPMPHEGKVDLGVLDADYVNVAVNGHEPFVGAALIVAAKSKAVQERAKAAGAKGLRVVGFIETGQELLQRYPTDEVFAGLTGNWLSTEAGLATGAVDVFAMDNSCSPPNIGLIAEKHGATLVAVSPLIGVPGTKHRLHYAPEKAADIAARLIDLGLENFQRRRGNGATRGLRLGTITTGFSAEAVAGALGGSLAPLLEVIKAGQLPGIVALVSCTTYANGGQDVVTTAVARELVKRNLLVLSAGCGNAACQVAGLNSLAAQDLAGPTLKPLLKQLGIPPVLSFGTCSDTGRLALLVGTVADALGVDTAQLPVAVTAPEYMEQKATIDASAAVALGLYTHVSPLPPVTGGPALVKLLTEDVEGLVGGKFAVETDPIEAVNGIERHIQKKRAALGLK
jgi:carbon-monoxide dehydrogenase catalytic subunit